MAGFVVWELIVIYNPNGEFYTEPMRHALYETKEAAQRGWKKFRNQKDFHMKWADHYEIRELEVLQ